MTPSYVGRLTVGCTEHIPRRLAEEALTELFHGRGEYIGPVTIERTDHVVTIDDVYRFASEKSSVWHLHAFHWDEGKEVPEHWTVEVKGTMDYGITLNVEGWGETLDIACRDAIHKIEQTDV